MNRSRNRSRNRRACALLLVIVLLVLMGLLVSYPPATWLPAQQWGEELESAGATGAVVFFTLGSLAASVGFPRQMLAFIAGLAYGVQAGFIISLATATLACYLTVQLSQRFLGRWVARRFPAVVEKLDLLLEHDVFIKVLVLRLQPLGTNMLSNICIGFTNVSRATFVLASAVGYMPQMVVFCLLGSGVRVGSTKHMWISVALLLASVVLGLVVYQRHFKRKHGPV